jgi:hypothetical protein
MVNGPHLMALVRAGAGFVNGKLVERPEDQAAPAPDQSPAAAPNVAAEAALPVSVRTASGWVLRFV